MPNTLTTIFTSTPASEPVESPHPNTGVYVLGTQLGNGTWQVVHTLVSKTSTPPTITGRLKNFPAIAASVVASGNVLNNVLATPTGTSAVASSATAINATVSSNPNATAYRLLSSATAGGTYAPIYQGAAAGFAHTGLTAGTTYYYEWQFVGGGYYDDSAASAVFSATAGAAAQIFTPVAGDYALTAFGRTYGATGFQSYVSQLAYNTASAAYVDVQLISNQASLRPGKASCSVFLDGAFQQQLKVSTDNTAQVFRLNLPGDATNRVLSIVGGSICQDGQTAVEPLHGTGVVNVSFPAGSTNTLHTFAKQAIGLLTNTDSIGVGEYTATPEVDGWLPKLRGLLPTWDMASSGWGGRSLFASIGDSTGVQASVQEAVAYLSPYATQYLLLALSTNDASQNRGTPTALAAATAAYFDALRAALPTVKIFLQTATAIANEATANAGGFTFSQYRQAQAGVAAGRPWVFVVDGPALVTNNVTNFSDGTHETAAGGTIHAQNLLAKINVILSSQGQTMGTDNFDPSTPAGSRFLYLNPATNVAADASSWQGKDTVITVRQSVSSSRLTFANGLATGTGSTRYVSGVGLFSKLNVLSFIAKLNLTDNGNSQNIFSQNVGAMGMVQCYWYQGVITAWVRVVPDYNTGLKSVTIPFTGGPLSLYVEYNRTANTVTLLANGAAGTTPSGSNATAMGAFLDSSLDLFGSAAPEYAYGIAGTTSGLKAFNYALTSTQQTNELAELAGGAPAETTFSEMFAAVDTRFVEASTGTGATTRSNGLTLQPGIQGATSIANQAKLTSAAGYDLRGRTLVLNIASVANSADNVATLFFWAGNTAYADPNSVGFALQGNVLYAQFCDAHGTYASVAYSATAQKYLRLRVSADGLTFYCDYSADNATWTNLLTQALGGVSLASAKIALFATQTGTAIKPGAQISSITLA